MRWQELLETAPCCTRCTVSLIRRVLRAEHAYRGGVHGATGRAAAAARRSERGCGTGSCCKRSVSKKNRSSCAEDGEDGGWATARRRGRERRNAWLATSHVLRFPRHSSATAVLENLEKERRRRKENAVGEQPAVCRRAPGGEEERKSWTQTRDRVRSLLSSLPARAATADPARDSPTRCDRRRIRLRRELGVPCWILDAIVLTALERQCIYSRACAVRSRSTLGPSSLSTFSRFPSRRPATYNSTTVRHRS
jgi:hypothetical protein